MEGILNVLFICSSRGVSPLVISETDSECYDLAKGKLNGVEMQRRVQAKELVDRRGGVQVWRIIKVEPPRETLHTCSLASTVS